MTGPVSEPTDYAYHLTRRARGLPLWFSLSVTEIGLPKAIGQRSGWPANRGRDPGTRPPGAGQRAVAQVCCSGASAGTHATTAWADQLLHDQVAFIPPSAWSETVAGSFCTRTSMDGPRSSTG